MHTYKIVSNFKERLVALCESSPMSDTEISKALGISKQTLSAWRCGTRSPKGPTIETIARFFHVTVDWLMGFDVPADGSDKEKPIPEDELDNELISLLSDLTPEEIVRVADFVSGLKAAREGAASRNK